MADVAESGSSRRRCPDLQTETQGGGSREVGKLTEGRREKWVGKGRGSKGGSNEA